MRQWYVAVTLVGLASCGRVGYEDRACPQGTVEVGDPEGGVPFCIEGAQHETSMTYLGAIAHCESRGMRLCSSAEWYAACSSGDAALVDMVGDWEWVGELVDATNAKKRGGGSCEDWSQHTIDSGEYTVRCCSSR